MALAHITDLSDRIAARVLSQYKTLNRFMGLLRGLTDAAQEVEDALWGVVAQFDINQAEGVWLDLLGKFVGQARQGLGDVDYRRFIAQRVIANRSNGTIAEILGVAAALTLDVTHIALAEYQPASVELDISDYAMAEPVRTLLMQMLRATRSAGIRLMVTYWPDSVATNLFTCSTDDTMQASSLLGFGSDSDPAVGGKFIDADVA